MAAMASIGPESDANDAYWDDAFTMTKIDNYVYSSAKDSFGNIYIAGVFTTAFGIPANYIIRWNGTEWSTLGSGTNGLIESVVGDNAGNLYACGQFTTAGGVAANYIAKWNGSEWSALGSGMNGGVAAIGFDKAGNLYAGGYFTTAGGVAANNIAKWDGSTWTALGSGVDNVVWTLVTDDAGNLYAGGNFETAGGVSTGGIAKWDGSAWSSLGTGANGAAMAIAVDKNGKVYASGYFSVIGGLAASIAVWDGVAWSLPEGWANSDYGCNCIVKDDAGNLYFGGGEVSAGDVSEDCILKWDGSTWTGYGAKSDGSVQSVVIDNTGNVYACGGFTTMGSITAHNLAKWNGSAWTSWDTGEALGNYGYAITDDGEGNVYVGGQFVLAGAVATKGIAKWNGSAWSPFGGDLNGVVRAFAKDKTGNLYVGGNFLTTGNVATKNVAKWDGSAWSALGSGISNTGNCMVMSLATDATDNLYAAGIFTTAGGVAAKNIAKWDGTAWSPLGGGLVYSGMATFIYSIKTDSAGNLYAGGQFDSAGGAAIKGIAKWDGSTWSQLGSGVNGSVTSIYIDNMDNVYAAGGFTTAGGVAANRIAKWDGAEWSPLGSGVSSASYSIVQDSAGNLYAGGVSTTAGSVAANHVAKWDGSSWSAFGSGTNSFIYGLFVNRNTLFATGYQTTAGGKTSSYFSVWQPRVNQSTASFAETPGAQTLGNDIYGFYKPALTTDASTTIAYSSGLPVDVTLDRADEIHVDGNRINGALTLGPENVEFGDPGATLRVEFSEDDAAAFGVPYTEFRAAKLTYPSDYPTNKEAATVTSVGAPTATPAPIRIENGKQIYAISVPLTAAGSTYSAAPQSLIKLPAPANPSAIVEQNAITWTWTWTDNSNGQAQFKVFDDPGANPPTTLQTTEAFGVSSWRHNGLTPNCLYSFQAVATNGVLDSLKTPTVTRYTLAGPPSIGNNVLCDKAINTPYGPGATCKFTNPAGFGVGAHGGSAYKVNLFRYVWNKSATYAFSGGESIWSNGALKQTPSGSGEYYLHLQSLNAYGYPSATLDYGPFQFDMDAPSGGVTINGGASYCNSAVVSLALAYKDGSGSGASEMEFSNDGSDWSAWEAIATTKAWTLSSGDNAKTVYVKFKDAAGNESEAASAAIILDTAAPVFTTLTATPPIAAENDTVTLTFFASETLLLPPEVTVNGHKANEVITKAGSEYTFSYLVQNPQNDPSGPATIEVSGLDPAGNLGVTTNTSALTIEKQATHAPAMDALGFIALVALINLLFIRAAIRRGLRD